MRPIAAALLLALAAPSRAEAPITLDDALAEAARANPDLRASRADVDLARSDRAAAWSGVLPRLDLSAGFGHSFIGRSSSSASYLDPITGQVVTTGQASDYEAYSASLQLSQTILDWTRFVDVDRAGWNLRGQQRRYDERALSVAFEVTSRFYDLVKAERTLGVLEATAIRSEELVARADALFNAGKAPKSDTYTARANLQNDRISAESARSQVEQARAALAQVLGRTDPASLEVVAPPALDAAELPSPELTPLADLLTRARERRPVLAADRALVEAADLGVSSARGGYLPSLTAVGSYNRQGAGLGGTGGVYGDPSRDYTASAQVVVSWNLLAGGFTRAQEGRARAAAESTRAGAARDAQQVAREVAVARAAAVSFARQVALSSESLAVAREGLRLATERFNAGLASQLEVRDANLKLTQAELSLVEARIDHAVAVADLARAVGGAP